MVNVETVLNDCVVDCLIMFLFLRREIKEK
jgi:hypothetical protein